MPLQLVICKVHSGACLLAGILILPLVLPPTVLGFYLLVWLGPAIGAVSYEVGDDVRSAFVTQSESTRAAFAPSRPGHWHCDLYTLARQQLAALGVTRIHGGGFDTFADPRFYSYRRDGARSGRFASLIWIQP